MRSKLSAIINSIITFGLIVVVFATPLLFTDLLTEFFEIPKVAFIIGSSLVLLTLWALSWVVKGKVLITRTPLDIPLLLLLVIVIVSAIFSPLQHIAIFGNLPRVHGSAASIVAYILIYFIASSHLRTQTQVKTIVYALLASAAGSSLITLLAYFGLFLPFNFAKNLAFTPAGSSFSASGLAALLLPITLLSSFGFSRFLNKYLSTLLTTLFALTIVLVGSTATFVTMIAALGLVFLTAKKDILKKKSLPLFVIPFIVSLTVLVLSFVPPMVKIKNPLFEKRSTSPREIQLSFTTSWKVAVSAFRDYPFVGSGPNTYLFNFTSYRPVEHNNTKFWNLRFENAHNEFLQTLATLGGLGLLSLIFLSAVVIAFAWRTLVKNETPVSAPLAISALLAILMLTLHVSTPVIMLVSFTIFALLMASQKETGGKVEEISLGIRASKLYDSNLIVGDILPIILFIPAVALVVIAFWNLSTAVLADYHHRKALNAASSRGLDTYNSLIKAAKFNPRADLYRTDLAQTNFALANAIAASKVNQADGTNSLTDQDKQNIQQLLSQAINEGKIAVALNPNSAQNWEILGSIYRQISGVAQNATQFALDSYGRAIQKDPFNPVLRLNVGGIYYSLKNYDLAIRFFTDAVTLKPDYANGYYNLAVALRDKGDTKNAILVAEKVVSLLKPENPDYQAASNFLNELKSQAATGSTTTAPAAKEESALQKKSLPKVLDLPKKNDIATPAAVKKSSE
ncbi:MAG: hypothetical protein US86_C0004G0032 [Candidatus Daviesbacteria bacterium GW2011_GWA2_38_24]|uniref:O-antigen ligase-related domain-containing protein n=1 Tax=Candidatus Daviesbacteria bacterium GW2011_GWA2_38_24 TaxID=1618422 RepID=A0A0G0LZC3_9BACT|nr:MAG: hypothetical protein US86_C0004G0032 [Candidatus Daviesbacteria bacterium GW2011_GWA2_38_24]KKQ78901.1 MAG: hypothetical protein UT01_C0056G0004 [Candidatus Daviesbacteria bacterium GW2011_GWA1_38_7]